MSSPIGLPAAMADSSLRLQGRKDKIAIGRRERRETIAVELLEEAGLEPRSSGVVDGESKRVAVHIENFEGPVTILGLHLRCRELTN